MNHSSDSSRPSAGEAASSVPQQKNAPGEKTDVRIVLDAYGGDNAPRETVAGSIAAAEKLDHTIIVLCGGEEELEQELDELGGKPANVEVVHAPERIGMHEGPVKALRSKKNSSIAVGANLVADGKADAFVSAGNTGAVVAASTLGMRMLEGVQKPGIAVPMRAIDHPVVAIDVGANVHCKPAHLMQYAIMANVFAVQVLHMENPRVGLLNVGEEDGKGTQLTKGAFELLQDADINFVGNVEGDDVFGGGCDIVVCDGFAGNVMLKVAESLVMKLIQLFRAGIDENLRRKLGYVLLKDVFEEIRHCGDYSEYGCAPLLGVDGIALIGHGRSDARAIENAVAEARSFVDLHVNDKIAHAISAHMSTL